MFRLVIIAGIIIALAGGAAWLADHPGSLIIEWDALGQSWELRTTFALAVILLFVLGVILLLVHRFVLSVGRAPRWFSESFAARRRRKGLNAAARGLVAAAEGDTREAERHSRVASDLLENDALVHLLGAQTAQLKGDQRGAQGHFEAMLDDEETQVLGLRGLLSQARLRGDDAAALKYASKAFERKPKLDWAYRALLDLQCDKGDWAGALLTLDKARKAGAAESESVKRQKAVLLSAKAYAALSAGNDQEAESDALKAHRLMPSFAPASTLGASLLTKRGQSWKASGLVEEAWRASPHPALVEAYIALKPEESARERAKRLSGLAEMRNDHMESQLLLARQAINTRRWEDAREILTPLSETMATPRVCALMAELEQGESANVGAARQWLARAVAAPSEPDWVRSSFDFSDREWSELVETVSAEDTTWPPQLDPALFSRDPNVVAPFTAELQPEDNGATMTAQVVEGEAEVVIDQSADDQVQADVQRKSHDQVISPKPQKPDPSGDGGEDALRSVKRGSTTVTYERKKRQILKSKASQIGSRILGARDLNSGRERPPDDPGPREDEDTPYPSVP